MNDIHISNKEWLMEKDIFIYLSNFPIFDNFNLQEESDLKLVTQDFNDFAKNNCTPEFFYRSALLVQKLLSVPKFSFFRRPISNVFPYKEITLGQWYEITKNPKYYSVITEKLRNIDNKAEAQKFKAANFDYVTVSGIFSKRAESGLVKHSNLLVLDFDNMANIPVLKRSILSDETLETLFLCVSPSGTGLKSVIRIDTSKHDHLTYFKGVQNYFRKTYHTEIDPSGKDVCRACFVCYDPEVYIHPNYL